LPRTAVGYVTRCTGTVLRVFIVKADKTKQ